MGNCCSVDAKDLVDEAKLEQSYQTAKLASNLVTQKVHVDPWSRYDLVEKLGVGSMGTVFVVKAKASNKAEENNELFALKTIRESRLTPLFVAELKNEIRAIRLLDHPHIIRFFEVYYFNNIHIVMDYCSGGDLYTRQPYSEIQAASIVRQVLSALAYMHSRNFIHRDVKFENIMFVSNEEDSPVTLIDFGFFGRYDPDSGPLQRQLGTPNTMAPEVYNSNYTTQADMWSLGVVTYELLTGKKAFTAVNPAVINHEIHFDIEEWRRLSEKPKEFCRTLLHRRAEHRPTAAEAMKHKWLQNSPSHQETSSWDRMSQQVTAYGKSPTLKKLGLLMIAHKAFPMQLKSLREKFEQYDTEQNGVISMEEFRAALIDSHSGYTEVQIRELFDSMDTYHNGEIAYTEFVAALLESYVNLTEDKILDAFERLDSDNSGFISNDNLKHVLGRDFTDEAVQEIMDAVNPAEEGKISYEEFLHAFREKGLDLGREAKVLPQET